MNKELVNPYLLTYKNGEGISPYQNQYHWFETEEELREFVNHFKEVPGFQVIEAMEILEKRDIILPGEQ